MSYQDAVNAFAYRRAAQVPHFRRGPGPIHGGTKVTITASEVELLDSEELVVRQPFSAEVNHELIDWSLMGSSMLNHDPAFKNHVIDYQTNASLVQDIEEGWPGTEVTPGDPDAPVIRVTVKCGTCDELVRFNVSLDDALRGVLETGW